MELEATVNDLSPRLQNQIGKSPTTKVRIVVTDTSNAPSESIIPDFYDDDADSDAEIQTILEARTTSE